MYFSLTLSLLLLYAFSNFHFFHEIQKKEGKFLWIFFLLPFANTLTASSRGKNMLLRSTYIFQGFSRPSRAARDERRALPYWLWRYKYLKTLYPCLTFSENKTSNISYSTFLHELKTFSLFFLAYFSLCTLKQTLEMSSREGIKLLRICIRSHENMIHRLLYKQNSSERKSW